MRDGEFLRTSCGSPNYAAPEVISGNLYAGPEVDVWSCGVIVYIVMCGYPPFYDENQNKLFQKIKAGRYSFHKKFWSHTSEDAKDLIRKMLTVDQTKRASCAALLSHPWFGTDTGHVDLRHSIKHLRDAHSTNDLRFEQGHTANGAHAAPHGTCMSEVTGHMLYCIAVYSLTRRPICFASALAELDTFCYIPQLKI